MPLASPLEFNNLKPAMNYMLFTLDETHPVIESPPANTCPHLLLIPSELTSSQTDLKAHSKPNATRQAGRPLGMCSEQSDYLSMRHLEVTSQRGVRQTMDSRGGLEGARHNGILGKAFGLPRESAKNLGA